LTLLRSKIIGQETGGGHNFKYFWVGLGPAPAEYLKADRLRV